MAPRLVQSASGQSQSLSVVVFISPSLLFFLFMKKRLRMAQFIFQHICNFPLLVLVFLQISGLKISSYFKKNNVNVKVSIDLLLF